MSLITQLHTAQQRLHDAHISTAQLDAEVLLAHALEVDRVWLHTHPDTVLTDTQIHQYETFIKRRLQHEPVAYIIGKKEFYGRECIVTPDVLIPRPETEDLIDLAKSLPLPEDTYVIDVGTGSGCVGLTLKAEIATIRDMILCDISEPTLVVAKQNNRHTFHATKVQYYHSDLLSFWQPKTVKQPFAHLIVANLPYVDTSWETSPELAYEPSLALYADDHGLELIKQLIGQSTYILKDGGFLLLEADPEQHPVIIGSCQRHGLAYRETRGYAISFQKTS